MVIRGGTRGNGRQAGRYLTDLGENESIEILEVDGRLNADADYLHKVVESMSLMEELTKSKKGLYHAQINPAYGEDNNMDWFKAADMLGEELGLQDQRRVIVKHVKKGRAHAHVVWERYNHETGIMVSDSFSRLAQDRARQRMEIEFGHKQTPRRNQHRPQLKASLNQLWNQTGTGAQFITACKNNDYMIAQGSGRNPFIVVDENGHSFDLVRQLKGVRLKDVRHRLRNETLMTEKAAIVYMRNQKSDSDTSGREKQKAQFTMTAKHITENVPNAFGANTTDATQQPQPTAQSNQDALKAEFKLQSTEFVQPTADSTKTIAKEFAENKQDKQQTELQRMRKALAEQRKIDQEKKNDPKRDKGMEYD